MTMSRDVDYPDEIRRNRGQIDSDYLAYLTSGHTDSAAKKGEPGAAEQDEPGVAEQDEPGVAEQDEPGVAEQDEPGIVEQDELGAVEPDEPGAVEQVDPEYSIFFNSLRKIKDVWHVKADEKNRLVQGYILEDVIVGDDAELPIPVFSHFDQHRKRKTENGTDSDSAYAADPNPSENEKRDATENMSHSRKGGHTENCNPMATKDFQFAKRVKLEVDNLDDDLMLFLESKVVGTDGPMNIDASFRRGNPKSPKNIGGSKPSYPEHIVRPKPRSPEYIGRQRSPEYIGRPKPRSPTHNERSKRSYRHMRSSEIKSPVPIPSLKHGSHAQTRSSKIIPENIGGSLLKPPVCRSPVQNGSSKMKSPVKNGSFKPETPRHIQGSKPEPPVQIRRPKPEPHVPGFKSSNVGEDEDLVCLGSPSEETSSPFRDNLMTVLEKPFDRQELRMLEEKAKSSKKVERLVDLRNGREKLVATDKDGKAFIDHYPDFRRKLKKYEGLSLTRLNLLRGFFFWIQHLTQDGAFQPWQDERCNKKILPPNA